MFQFPRCPPSPAGWSPRTTAGGLPHSGIPGSTLVGSSPGPFVAYHALHRHQAPRHPPSALRSFCPTLKSAKSKSSSSLVKEPSRHPPQQRRLPVGGLPSLQEEARDARLPTFLAEPEPLKSGRRRGERRGHAHERRGCTRPPAGPAGTGGVPSRPGACPCSRPVAPSRRPPVPASPRGPPREIPRGRAEPGGAGLSRTGLDLEAPHGRAEPAGRTDTSAPRRGSLERR